MSEKKIDSMDETTETYASSVKARCFTMNPNRSVVTETLVYGDSIGFSGGIFRGFV